MMQFKKSVIAAILTLHSVASIAGWVLFEGTDEVEIYVDLSAILKNEQVASVEYLMNFSNLQLSKGVKSAVDVAEFDCEQKRKRTLSMTNYSEPMGQGRVLFNSKEATRWRPVSVDGMDYALWQFACKKP
ncbi:surface-adhesin E family protein [Limnohabitans sp.]|uniref:surface-adhesin E family protein n=1 Tax=Limnohabitans sp. TaxID=1907725 RepID=UPI0038BC4473